MGKKGRLVVVSNRVPSLTEATTEEDRRNQTVGGLVSALLPVFDEEGGVWFGWSGRTVDRDVARMPVMSSVGPIQIVTLGLSRDEAALFYTVFANQSLWPILHSFPSRAVIRRDAYRAYRRVNTRFAETLCPMLEEGDIVWVHDYHLIPFGQALRRAGWEGKLGFFLHTPFPSSDAFSILPW